MTPDQVSGAEIGRRSRLRRLGLITILIGGTCLGASVVGFSPASAQGGGISGTWTTSGTGGWGPQSFVITDSGGTLSGQGVIPGGSAFATLGGTLSGNSVSFTLTYTTDVGYVSTQVGTIGATGDTMSGTWTSTFKGKQTSQSGDWSATLAIRPSATGVSCNNENTGLPDEFFQCTAQVGDASGNQPQGTPSGSVSFTINPGGGGGFQGSSACALMPSQSGPTAFCSVNYVPPAPGAIPIGSQPDITATYNGSTGFAPSSGQPQNVFVNCATTYIQNCTTTTTETTTDSTTNTATTAQSTSAPTTSTTTSPPPISPPTPQAVFQALCAQQYNPICVGISPPPASLTQQCVSLTGSQAGAAQDTQTCDSSTQTVTVSTDQTTVNASASCPVTAGPLTQCDLDAYLASDNPDPALVAKVQYYLNYNTYKNEVNAARAAILTDIQSWAARSAEDDGSAPNPTANTATYNAISLGWSNGINMLYNSIAAKGTDAGNVTATGILSDTWCTTTTDPEGCRQQVAQIVMDINDSLSTLASRKAALGVNQPLTLPQTKHGPLMAAPSTAAHASKTKKVRQRYTQMLWMGVRKKAAYSPG